MRQAAFIGPSKPDHQRSGIVQVRCSLQGFARSSDRGTRRLSCAAEVCRNPVRPSPRARLHHMDQWEVDVLATAGAVNAPMDLVYNNIQPLNGISEIRVKGQEEMV